MDKHNSTQVGMTSDSPLWPRLIEPGALWLGWQRVRSNGGGAGGDGVSQAAFARAAPQRIKTLAAELAAGHYYPGPYRKVAIPKKRSGERILAIPCIVDRVVQTAAASLLSPILEPGFEPSSFAYRPGRGVARAVQAVLRHRRDGYVWAAEGDIARCFDEIPHESLLVTLEAAIGDARVTDLVGLWLGAFAPGGIGIPQGAPISPLLCNLHLDAVDEAIAGSGVRLVRYADDFVILAKSAGKAEAGLERMAGLLRMHGLALNPDKSRIVAAGQALRFLGHMFVRSMAYAEVEADDELPAPPDAPSEEVLARWAVEARQEVAEEAAPETRPTRRRPLFVIEPGALLSVRNDSFLVLGPEERGHETDGRRAGRLLEHANRIDRIEIGPGAEADWSALALAAARAVPLAMVDSWGRTIGWTSGPGDIRARRVAAQARWLADDACRDRLARILALGRIRNQMLRLRKLNLKRKDARIAHAATALRRVALRLPEDATAAEARGHEGNAGRIYWPAWSLTIPTEFGFGGTRDRRPPPDPVNACLGYLYALLERDVRVAIERAGLHPGLAALHSERDDGDALVYDLMEAFRAAISEAALGTLIGRRAIKADMFVIREEYADGNDVLRSCRIEPAARRALIQGHESWCAQNVTSRRTGRMLSWRALLEEEARALADLFVGDVDSFKPYELDY